MDSESIRSEVAFRFSRSSGPGGQHAQKTSTRVEALFDVEASAGLTPAERERVLRRLGPVVRGFEIARQPPANPVEIVVGVVAGFPQGGAFGSLSGKF